jgi:cytochrome P450
MATHPEDLARLVENPAMIPDAVEEFLRAYPAVSMGRKVTRDVDFHGCPMKKDQMVLLTIQSATRDPRSFDHPDQVIIDRRPNHHIAYGASAHRCIGSHLSRAQLQIAIREWNRIIPEYWVQPGEEVLERGSSLVSLPLAWKA